MSADDLQIRRAEARDLAALVAVEAGFPSDRIRRRSFQRLLRSKSAEIWVAERAGAFCGDLVLLFRAGALTGNLYSVIVNPDYQRQGIAAALYRHAVSQARAHGRRGLLLRVREDNPAGQGVAMQAGFRVIPGKVALYDDGATGVHMRLDL